MGCPGLSGAERGLEQRTQRTQRHRDTAKSERKMKVKEVDQERGYEMSQEMCVKCKSKSSEERLAARTRLVGNL